MLLVAYLLIAVATVWLAVWALDYRFNLIGRYNKWRTKTYWRDRNRKERRRP